MKNIFVKSLPKSKSNGFDLRLIYLMEIGYNISDVYSGQKIVEWPGIRLRDIWNNKLRRNSLYVSQDNPVNYYLRYCQHSMHLINVIQLIRVWLRQIVIHIYFSRVGYLKRDDFFLTRFFANNVLIPHCVVLFDVNKDWSVNAFKLPLRFDFWGSGNYLPNRLALLRIQELGINFPQYNFNVWGLEYQKSSFAKGWIENVLELKECEAWAIFPLEVGSGIKNKVIESILIGIPSIGLTEAYSGIIGFENYLGIFRHFNNLEDFLKGGDQDNWRIIYDSFIGCRKIFVDFYRTQDFAKDYYHAHRNLH